MTKPLDELYLTWLYSQIGSIRHRSPSKTYWTLIRQLYTKEFVWIVPNDDNRVEDGRDLRYEFVEEQCLDDVDPNWMGLGCSMLEMLIGLSRRLAFETDGEPRDWFWTLMENLGLNELTDAVYRTPDAEVEDILDSVIWRTFKRDGRGGLFPLRHAARDQRDTEIWYQLSAYLIENYMREEG